MLSGCAESKDVVRYDYVASHWTAERVTMDESVQRVDPKTLLTQCEEQELISEIEGVSVVFDEVRCTIETWMIDSFISNNALEGTV
ncbi:hypothetical protein ACW7EJ_19260, partial [Acinetobacter soli]